MKSIYKVVGGGRSKHSIIKRLKSLGVQEEPIEKPQIPSQEVVQARPVPPKIKQDREDPSKVPRRKETIRGAYPAKPPTGPSNRETQKVTEQGMKEWQMDRDLFPDLEKKTWSELKEITENALSSDIAAAAKRAMDRKVEARLGTGKVRRKGNYGDPSNEDKYTEDAQRMSELDDRELRDATHNASDSIAALAAADVARNRKNSKDRSRGIVKRRSRDG